MKKTRIEEKREKEQKSANELFSQLPAKLQKKLLSLWNEYAAQESYEAKVVKALDKIEALIQVLEYSKGVLYKEELTFSLEYAIPYCKFDPFILSLLKYVLDNIKKNFKEFKK